MQVNPHAQKEQHPSQHHNAEPDSGEFPTAREPKPAIEQDGQTSNSTSPNDKHSANDYAKWGFWISVPATFATLAVAISNAIQASAAKVTAMVLSETERARITTSLGGLPAPNGTERPVKVHCHLKNSGKTTALVKVATQGYSLLQPGEILNGTPASRSRAEWSGAGLRIAPGESFDLPIEVSPERAQIVIAGKAVLWVAGRFIYKDVFGLRHETAYTCRYILRSASGDPEYFVVDGRPEDTYTT